MSYNELQSRRSRYSEQKYENSSICNRSFKSELNNLSIELPHKHIYNRLEKQIIHKSSPSPKIIINLASTRYPILEEVCLSPQVNWKIENYGQSRQWTIKWCDTGVTNETLLRMHYLQKINHFPGMFNIARKNTLAINLTRMKQEFPEEYDFFPRTFLYPADAVKIKKYHLESRKKGLLKTFIVKPEAGCQGRGIYLTQNPSDFERQQKCVIQKYISNPLLYNGLKFDFRIYVLVASINPLRLYIYNEGLVRFSTEKYQFPTISNLHNHYMHLTNYAINKDNPNYQFNNSVHDMSHGHKKSMAQFFKTLKQMGYRANSYWAQIKDIIIKTIITAQPHLIGNYKSSRPTDPIHDMCFQVLGFDFMVDNNSRVFLLQVNHTPSFSADTPLDVIIKKNLIKDTLLMMNFTEKEISIKQQLERIKQRQKIIKRQNNQQNDSQKNKLIYELNEIRNWHEYQNKGTYQPIYPCKNPAKMNLYSRMMLYSTASYQKMPSNSTLDLRTRVIRDFSQKNKNNSNLKRIFTQAPSQLKHKTSLLYNYNYKPNSNKVSIYSNKILSTLPSQNKPLERIEEQRNASGRQSTVQSHKKLKTEQSATRETIIRSKIQSKTIERTQAKQTKIELGSIRKRIRSYKTPLMF